MLLGRIAKRTLSSHVVNIGEGFTASSDRIKNIKNTPSIYLWLFTYRYLFFKISTETYLLTLSGRSVFKKFEYLASLTWDLHMKNSNEPEANKITCNYGIFSICRYKLFFPVIGQHSNKCLHLELVNNVISKTVFIKTC